MSLFAAWMLVIALFLAALGNYPRGGSAVCADISQGITAVDTMQLSVTVSSVTDAFYCWLGLFGSIYALIS